MLTFFCTSQASRSSTDYQKIILRLSCEDVRNVGIVTDKKGKVC